MILQTVGTVVRNCGQLIPQVVSWVDRLGLAALRSTVQSVPSLSHAKLPPESPAGLRDARRTDTQLRAGIRRSAHAGACSHSSWCSATWSAPSEPSQSRSRSRLEE